MNLIEHVQYKAALIVASCWQGTSLVRLYNELGWESLSNRRWARRMITFYKIKNGLAPSYLSDHILEHGKAYMPFRHSNIRAHLELKDMTSFSHIALNFGTI